MSEELPYNLCNCARPTLFAYSCCCPCLLAGDISKHLGEDFLVGCGGTILTTPMYIGGCQRYSVLNRMNKSNGIVIDFLVGCFCCCCSQVQMELCLEKSIRLDTLKPPPQFVIHSTNPDTAAENIRLAYESQN